MMQDQRLGAKEIIEYYQLRPLLPEGGWFRRFWYKKDQVSQIYYLLRDNDFSEFHRLPTDEQFLFLSGDPVEHYREVPGYKTLKKEILGTDIGKKEKRDLLVDAHCCQAIRLAKGGKWALMSTVMSPPFKMDDYQSIGSKEMIDRFPEQANIIKELTRS